MPETCIRCHGTGVEPDPTEIGRRARSTRNGQGLGLPELARLLGCSVSHLSDLERGLRAWSGPTARAYLKLLELKADGS